MIIFLHVVKAYAIIDLIILHKFLYLHGLLDFIPGPDLLLDLSTHNFARVGPSLGFINIPVLR